MPPTPPKKSYPSYDGDVVDAPPLYGGDVAICRRPPPKKSHPFWGMGLRVKVSPGPMKNPAGLFGGIHRPWKIMECMDSTGNSWISMEMYGN